MRRRQGFTQEVMTMSTSNEEKQLIEGLFDRLAKAEKETGERDPQASEQIQQRVAAQPHSPYYMAQTIIIQEEALKRLNARVEELERNTQSQSSGGFLAGLFGGDQNRGGSREQTRRAPPASSGFANAARGGRGGGFLGGALQTAAGVAGGVLLGNMLMDMFGGGEPGMEEGLAAEDASIEPDESQGLDGGFDEGLGDDDFF